jgi:hypothetical protein
MESGFVQGFFLQRDAWAMFSAWPPTIAQSPLQTCPVIAADGFPAMPTLASPESHHSEVLTASPRY